MTRRIACLLGCLLTASVAQAQDAETPEGASAEASTEEEGSRAELDAARSHMERGQELYVQGRYLEAAEEFKRAYEAQPFGAFLYNAGRAYERHGEWSRAADFLARYLEQDPGASDAAEVTQRIDRLRTRAAQEAAASEPAAPSGEEGTTEGAEPAGEEGTAGEGTSGVGTAEEGATGEGTGDAEGTGESAAGEATDRPPVDVEGPPASNRDMKSLLAIRTDPLGATVTVRKDNREVATGPAPFAHTLAEGEYRVVVEHPDYRTVEERVVIRPGKVYVVIVEMSQGQFLGYLRIVTDVPGANVYIDDREEGAVGATPFQNVISTGEHRIWIDKPGYQVEEREVEVGLGEDVTIRLDLTRVDYGRIRVVSNVRGAKVFVDDREVGEVPFEGEVAAGPRRVRVEADDMKDWEEQIDVRRGQLTPIRVRLRPSVGRGGAWVTTTLATLLVGGGVVLGVMSNQLSDELGQERDAGRLASDDSRILEGRLLAIGADAAFAVGGVLGVLAIYYFLRDPLPDSEGRVLEPRDWALAPHVSPYGAGAGLTWSF